VNFREKIRKRVLDDIASGDPDRMLWEDIPIQREGEETTYISAQNIPLADNKMMMSVVWDTTHRVRAEEEIRALNADLEERVAMRTRQLEETQEKLLRQERLATLGQLAGSVSHELRNPLGVISNAVYLLGQVLPRDEKALEYLEIIQAETRTAERIITDLLDFSRVKSPERAALSLAGLVEDTFARYPVPERVNVNINIPPGLPKLFVDGQHFTQVLGNLITNAYQAMPKGGELKVSAASVREKRIQMVRLDVADNGEGLAPELQARLFEPLFTTKARGIGLGLPTSKNLMEANGGWIEATSQPGKGSTFSLFLPAAQKEEE
jgi:signal transduction histidine kinase